MTPEETKAAIAVMQAFAEGKEIQFRSNLNGEWHDIGAKTPRWDWTSTQYRIRPKDREFWVLDLREDFRAAQSNGNALPAFCTKGGADAVKSSLKTTAPVIHVREVE